MMDHGSGYGRVSKQVLNQGTGVVFRSDDLDRDGTPDATGILAGDRHEHYYYAGWRLVETTNHVTGGGGYSYGDSAVLNQFVYGTQYIDEPVRYDRNLQAGTNTTCIGTGGDDRDASYFYHQDANWRTVALTGEDGQIVERVEYTAYGEPTLFGGPAPAGGGDGGGTDVPAVNGELGNAMLVSTVGNPFLHQGLFRDRETLTYHNRFRQYDSRSGRFMQRDPLYEDLVEAYEYNHTCPSNYVDPWGLQDKNPTTEPEPDKPDTDEERKVKTPPVVIIYDDDDEGGRLPNGDRIEGGEDMKKSAEEIAKKHQPAAPGLAGAWVIPFKGGLTNTLHSPKYRDVPDTTPDTV